MPVSTRLLTWSKYQGVVAAEKMAFLRNILLHGNDIGSMMKVVGEEGTSLEDFIVYLKEEMLDAVYLQQNSFDLIEANCGAERQRYVIDKLIRVLGSEYALKDKDEARGFFNRMRQKFIDWNYTEFMSEAFKTRESEIDRQYEEGCGRCGYEAEALCKGGE